MHHDGIGGGYINSGFDDGGAQLNIKTLRYEITHNFFQITLVHLAMRNRYARFGD
jgi:hypothetical protein